MNLDIDAIDDLADCARAGLEEDEVAVVGRESEVEIVLIGLGYRGREAAGEILVVGDSAAVDEVVLDIVGVAIVGDRDGAVRTIHIDEEVAPVPIAGEGAEVGGVGAIGLTHERIVVEAEDAIVILSCVAHQDEGTMIVFIAITRTWKDLVTVSPFLTWKSEVRLGSIRL